MTQSIDSKKMTHIDYMNRVWKAPVQSQAKYLLSYYATRFNFETDTNCWAKTETICREMQWSRGTVIHWKKYLERLGWIRVVHRTNTSDYVRVLLGSVDDACANRFPEPEAGIDHEVAIHMTGEN